MKNWKQCLIDKNASIYKVAEIINESGLQIALVVDPDMHLLGTVNDGDIRRAVLNRFDLNESVERVMKKTPITANCEVSDAEIRRIMQKHKVHQIPVVSREGIVCGLKLSTELIFSNQKTNPVILMAGGQGIRLRPYTENCPKPLLKVGDKPILETIIDSFINCGFTRFYIAVNYKSEMIENYFGDGSERGIEIKYLRERGRLGTAGALSLLPQEENEDIIVMNGDILTKVDFSAMLQFHQEEKSYGSMAVREYITQVPYGVIRYDGSRIISIEEKPETVNLVNAGIYILSPEVYKSITKEEYLDMTDVFAKVIEQGKKTSVFPIREYWLDIGKMDDFDQAQIDYRSEFRR